MTVSRLFYPAGIRVNATYLGHCGEQSVDNGLEDVTVFPSGDALPNFTGNKMHAPEYQVDTQDLAAALALMVDAGLAADLSAVNVDLFFREAKPQGLNEDVAGSGKHQIYRLEDNALLYWDSLQWSQDDDAAKLGIKCVPVYNGSNAIIQVPDEAIEAAAAQVAPWTGGPLYINGTLFSGIKSMQWQNNVQVEKVAADGEAWPTLVTIKQVKPVITIETMDLRAIAALDADGTAITQFTHYLRRRKPSRLNYADGDAQHIKLLATAGSLKWKKSGGNPATATVEIHLHKGAGDLFTISTGQTIVAGTTTTTTTTTTS
jgi:hypothetical protein